MRQTEVGNWDKAEENEPTKNVNIYFSDGNVLIGAGYPVSVIEHIGVAIECSLPIKLMEKGGKVTLINPRYVKRAEISDGV